MVTSDASLRTADSSRKGSEKKSNPRKAKRARPLDGGEDDMYPTEQKVPHWKHSQKQKLEHPGRPNRNHTGRTFPFDDQGQSSEERFDDMEGLGISTMLESSIEPLHNTTLNTHRKFTNPDSCAYPNAAVSECLDQSCGLLEDPMTSSTLTSHSAARRQMHGTADLTVSAPRTDQPNEWQMTMNAAFGSTSFLPVLAAAPSSMYSHQTQQCEAHVSHLDQKRQMPVGSWDLEPTPLIAPQAQTENSNDQRAAALARLLFHDESSL